MIITFFVIPKYVISTKVNLDLNGLLKKKNDLDNLKSQYKIINDFTVNKRHNFKFDEYSDLFATWDLFFESGTIQRFIRSGDTTKSITISKKIM